MGQHILFCLFGVEIHHPGQPRLDRALGNHQQLMRVAAETADADRVVGAHMEQRGGKCNTKNTKNTVDTTGGLWHSISMPRPASQEPLISKTLRAPARLWEAIRIYRHTRMVPTENAALIRLLEAGLEAEERKTEDERAGADHQSDDRRGGPPLAGGGTVRRNRRPR